MPRWLRRLLSTMAGIAAVVVVLGGVLLLSLQTPVAKRLLAERLETELATATGFGVDIGGIDGFLPFSATVSGIRLSDSRGPWLTADRLEVEWRPAALFAGRLHVRRIVAGEIAIAHAPVLPDRPEPQQPGVDLAIELPRLPLPTTIDELRIERLALAPDVLGTAAVLRAAGQASLGDATRDAAVALDVTRLDGGVGRASLQLAHSGSPASLTLAADIDEPQGGLIARALTLPGLPPVSLRLTGGGPATAWQGRLEGSAGPTRVDADVALAVDEVLALSVEGQARELGRLAPGSAAYVPPSVDVATSMRWQPGRRLEIERLSLTAADASAMLSGGLDFASGRIQASLDLAVADATRWRALLGPASVRSGRLAGTIAGTLDEPAFELQTAIDGVAAPDFAAERTEAKLRGRATLRDRHVVIAVSVAAEGRSSGMVVGVAPQLAPVLGDTANWSVRAEVDLLEDDIEINQARVAAKGSTVEAAGSIGGYGRAVDMTMQAELADIVPVAKLLDLPGAGRANFTAKLSGDALAPRLTADVSGRLADLVVDEPMIAALLGPAPTFKGTIAANSRDIDIGAFAIDGAGASVTAGGRMTTDASSLQLNIAATIPEVAPVAASLGVVARGQLAGKLRFTRTPERPQLHFAGTAESEGFVVDEATSVLLGPTVNASAEGSLGPGGVTLDAARIEGAAAQLAASGQIGDALALDYRLALSRLAALSPLAGTELDGKLTMIGSVTGPSRSPAVTGTLAGDSLRVAGISIASAEGKVSARDLGERPLGDIALDLVALEQRLSLATSYAVRDDGAVALNDLRLAAPQASLAGNLVLSPTGLVGGRVGGVIGDLAPIGSMFGQLIAGNGTIALTFASAEQGQAIGAELDLRNLSLSLPGSAPLSAEEIGLTADLRDAFGVPAGRAELRIDNAASGALRLTQSTIAIDGNAKALAIRLAAAGEHGRPLAVDTAGELALGGATQRLRLNSLDASFGLVKARLNAPVILSRDSGGMAIADLDATVGEGHLAGAGRLGTRQVDLQLSLADLPLEIVSAFAPQVDLGGAASAEFRLTGDVAAPAAHADIRLADLRVGGTRIGETVGISGTMTLDVREGGGSVTAKFGGPPDFALDGQVTAPLAFGLQPFALELADAAPIAGTVDGRLDLALVPQIIDLQGDQLGGRLALDMTVEGTLAAPRLVGEARIAEGSYATAAAGTVVRDVAAVVTGDNDRIVLRSLTAGDRGEGRLSASGAATLGAAEHGRYDGEVTLTRFAIPRGTGETTTASGHVAGNLQFVGIDTDGRRRIVATADASDLVIDGRDAGLFGPHMQASLEGALGDADILIETARVEGADGRFTANGQIAESIDLDYRLELSRLAALSSVADVELDGSADVAGTVTGPTKSPNVTATLSGGALRIADVALAGAEGTISARDLGGSKQGNIDLALTAQGHRLSLTTPYRLREDGAIALDGLRLTAPQTSLAGDIAMSPAGLLQGRLGGEIGDLALLDPFIGQSVAGAATLDLSFAPAKRTQAVKADVRIRNLSLAPAEGEPLTAEQVTLTANLNDALGTPSGQAEIRISNAATGELSLTRATVTAEGGKAMQVRLDAAGKHGQAFDIDAVGELALAPTAQRLRLDRLDARFGPVDAKLNAPATLSRDDRTVTLAGLDASIGKGRITGEGSLGRREVALQLALADLPLDIVTAFAPQMDLAGTASAELRLAGTPAAPTAHGEVRLKELRSGGTKIGESVALDGTVTFDVQDGRGAMTAKFGGPSDFALDGQVAVPIAFRAQPFALTVAPSAPLSGKVAGQIDLGLIPQIVDLHGDAMDGRLTLDITVAGTRAEPRLIGDARLANGSYASAEAGTTLRNVEATLTGDNERIVVRSLTATDGGQGRLTGSGSASLGGAGAPRYDGELTLERFTIINRIDAVATASGRLRLENATQRSQLAGDITIDSAELRIPEGLPPNIVKIKVIEVNAPPGRAVARAEPEAEGSAAPPVGLAVTVKIPGRAFLRGRGLESEWRGNLRVAGTMATPDITGRLEVVRGGLDLLGTRFDVESGTVTFIGGDKIDPELDFAAGAEANDINARVRVTGFASAPKFDIGSDSGLPPEEALSRLLFGQSAGSLTPGQAVQLAQAAATLSGGGPGVLDKLRSSVGLDVLSIESGGASPSDTSLKAGKYVSDKVFLKVEQGMTAESREVGVEVRVLPRVTVEGGVGHEGSGKVGINWRYDY